jgi:mono/diheme cytochrome c family protein
MRSVRSRHAGTSVRVAPKGVTAVFALGLVCSLVVSLGGTSAPHQVSSVEAPVVDRASDLHGGVWLLRANRLSRVSAAERPFLNRLIGARAVRPLSADAAFVLEPPNLLLARDWTGDGLADESAIVASGLAGGTSLVLTSDGWLLVGGTRLRFWWDGSQLTRWSDLAEPLGDVVPTAGGDLVALHDGELRRWPGDPRRTGRGQLLDAPSEILGGTTERLARLRFGLTDPASGELDKLAIVDSSDVLVRSSGWRWTRVAGEVATPATHEASSQMDVEALVQLCASSDQSRRALALEELVLRARDAQRVAAAIEPLRALARSHRDPAVRRIALCGLNRLGVLQTADLQAASSDGSPLVRRFASSLGDTDITGAPFGGLAATLRDPSAAIHAAAAVDAAIASLHQRATAAQVDELFRATRGHELLLLDRLIAKRGTLDGSATWWIESLIDQALASVSSSAEPHALRRLIERAAELAREGQDEIAQTFVRAAFAGTKPLGRRHAVVRLDRAPEGYRELLDGRIGQAVRHVDPWMRWPSRTDVEAPSLATTPQETIELGRQVYSSCMTCHGPAGRGQDGVYPPLAGSHYVTGDPERFAKILLHGVRGRIVVGSREIVGLMPRPPIETDEEIAAVMTYVRQAFGNDAPAVSPSVVRTVRERHASRIEPWDVSELDAGHTAGEGGTR